MTEDEAYRNVRNQDALEYCKKQSMLEQMVACETWKHFEYASRALEKQIPKKPIHIHEEHSEHLWKRDKNGEIDLWAFSVGYCNGPVCTRCWHSECEHCNEDWETDPTEPCVIDKDICPVCGSVLGKPKYCHECGQALDWSK